MTDYKAMRLMLAGTDQDFKCKERHEIPDYDAKKDGVFKDVHVIMTETVTMYFNIDTGKMEWMSGNAEYPNEI